MFKDNSKDTFLLLGGITIQMQVFWIKIQWVFLMCLFDFPCLWIYQKFTFCLDDLPKKKKVEIMVTAPNSALSHSRPALTFFAHVAMFPYVSAVCSIYFH